MCWQKKDLNRKAKDASTLFNHNEHEVCTMVTMKIFIVSFVDFVVIFFKYAVMTLLISIFGRYTLKLLMRVNPAHQNKI